MISRMFEDTFCGFFVNKTGFEVKMLLRVFERDLNLRSKKAVFKRFIKLFLSSDSCGDDV